MNAVGSMSTTLKAVAIGLIVLVLIVPLSMLQGLVSERAGQREEAYEKIAQGWGGAVTVGGPMLVVPTEYRAVENSITRVHRQDVYLLPQELDVTIDARQETEQRHVGIYQVPVFIASMSIAGRFDLATQLAVVALRYPDRTILWGQTTLRLPLSQVGSLRELGSARFGDHELAFTPVTRGPFGGLEAPIPLDPSTADDRRDFEFRLRMAGSRELSVLPFGSTTRVEMQSDWPHPSFRGAFLPAERVVTERGFSASWQVLELNRPYGPVITSEEIDPGAVLDSALGAGFYQAIDVYQRGERAIKYALLFIALTFMTMFAWEHVARVSLHPLQYLLVGLALSIFYLLLIALSEHLPFVYAYWIGATALVALIGIYLAGALHRRERGFAAATGMAGVYGVLYALVVSESYALLMGSIVLFIALATLMVTTRNVNWYVRSTQQADVHGTNSSPY